MCEHMLPFTWVLDIQRQTHLHSKLRPWFLSVGMEKATPVFLPVRWMDCRSPMQCQHTHVRGLPGVELVLSFPISCHFGFHVLACWGFHKCFFPVLGSAWPRPGLSSAEAGVGMPSEDPFSPNGGWRNQSGPTGIGR